MIGSITIARRVREGDVDKETLSSMVNVADVLCISFRKEQSMQRFRRLVYSINRQATYRYRTLRGDGSMYELLVLRLK